MEFGGLFTWNNSGRYTPSKSEASYSIALGIMNKPITEEALEGVYEQADQQISTIPYTFEAKEVIK